jgi:hypothetical protein
MLSPRKGLNAKPEKLRSLVRLLTGQTGVGAGQVFSNILTKYYIQYNKTKLSTNSFAEMQSTIQPIKEESAQ